MKLSIYNIESKIEEGLLIFNSKTSGILFLNDEYAIEYDKLKNDCNDCKINIMCIFIYIIFNYYLFGF